MSHDPRRFLNNNGGHPYMPPREDERKMARVWGHARLNHPELYAHELEVPELIRQYAPDLAAQIDEQRRREAA